MSELDQLNAECDRLRTELNDAIYWRAEVESNPVSATRLLLAAETIRTGKPTPTMVAHAIHLEARAQAATRAQERDALIEKASDAVYGAVGLADTSEHGIIAALVDAGWRPPEEEGARDE